MDRTLFGYRQGPEVEAMFPVIRRDGNAQKFPYCLDLIGGRRDGTESPWKTVVRETEEEIGINLETAGALCLHAERYPLRGLAGLDQGPDCPEEENMGVFLAVRLDDGFPPMSLGDEGEGLCLTTPSEFLSRKDVWPAFQQLAGRYLARNFGIEVKV